MEIEFKINKIALAQQFGRAASTYEDAAVLQKEVGFRLIDRLLGLNLKPKTILDLGSGTGFFTQHLQQHFPRAKVFSLDIAEGMIRYSKNIISEGSDPSVQSIHHVCGDAEFLPFKTHCFDLVFSNLAFQWCQQLTLLYNEINRVLKPKGSLLFTTFGPDTLQELRSCIEKLGSNQHIHLFMDMHHIGDLLLHTGFSDPIVDMEMMTLLYDEFFSLKQDLKMIGANFAPTKKIFNRKINLSSVSKTYELFRNNSGQLPASFEVIYGYAIGNHQKSLQEKPRQISKQQKIPVKLKTI